jgi:hypothetical protein
MDLMSASTVVSPSRPRYIACGIWPHFNLYNLKLGGNYGSMSQEQKDYIAAIIKRPQDLVTSILGFYRLRNGYTR